MINRSLDHPLKSDRLLQYIIIVFRNPLDLFLKKVFKRIQNILHIGSAVIDDFNTRGVIKNGE